MPLQSGLRDIGDGAATHVQLTQLRQLQDARGPLLYTAEAEVKIRQETQALAEQEATRAKIGLEAANRARQANNIGQTAREAGVVDVGTQAAEARIKRLLDLLPELTAKTKEAQEALDRLRNPPPTWNDPEGDRNRREEEQELQRILDQAEREEKRRQDLRVALILEVEERRRMIVAVKDSEAAVDALNRELAIEAAVRAQGKEATETEIELVRRLAAEKYDLDKAIRQATDARKEEERASEKAAQDLARDIKRTEEEIARTSERIATDVAEDIYDGLTSKDADILAWAKQLFKRIAVEALAARVILPITAQVVGSMPSMFGVQGPQGQAAAGGGSGVTGMAMNAASSYGMNTAMASMTGPGSMIGTAMGTTLVNGTTTGAITQSGSLAAAYSAPSTIAGSAGGATVGSVLGAGAAGAAAGGIVGSMIGNATQSKAIGAGSGALTGAAVGFMVGGPIGAAVGAIGGALMAALGTEGKPSNKEGNATYDLQTGRTKIGGQTGDKFSQENWDAAMGTTQAYATVAQMMGGYANRDVTGQIRTVMGDRDGISGSFNGATFSWKKRNEDAIGDMTEWFVRQFAAQLGDDLPGDVRTALQRIDWNDVESALEDLNFAGTFRDTLQSLRGDFGLVDQVTAATRAEIETLTDGIQLFKQTTARLGLDVNAADQATRSYVEGLLGLREVASPLNAAEAAAMQLQVRFQEMAPLLREVGIDAGEAAKGLQRAIAALREDFIAGLDAEFHNLRGAEWVNEIDSTFAVLADRMRSAAALGGGGDQALRNNHAALVAILSELSNEQLDEAANRYGGTLADLARSLKQSATEAAEAAAAFDLSAWLDELNREAHTLAGRGYVMQIVDQLTLLGDRMQIAAREGAGADLVLVNNHRALEQLLADLTDAQLADAAATFGGSIAQMANQLIAGRKATTDATAAQAAAQAAQTQVTQAAEDRVNAARNAVNQAYQKQIADQQALASSAQQTADNMRRFATSLKDFRLDLLGGDLSTLSPEERYNRARSAFEETAGRAAAGDETAIGQLQQVSSDFLNASRGYYASSDTYRRDFDRVQQALIETEASAGTQATAAEKAAAAANAQVTLLQNQLGAILGNTTATLSVEAAVRELTQAILAQAALSNATGAGAGMVGGIDVIGSAYQQYLGRAPDQGGYQNWQNQLNGGSTIGSVVGGIAGSDEAFIRNLYTTVLGREPDAGSANWANALQHGMSRAEVERLFKTTEEARSRGYAEGGLVTSGQWNRDSVNARLAGGEFVVKANAVNSQTLTALRRINSTGSVSNDNTAELRALRDETRRQTAALQDGFVRLLKLTERQTSDLADLRSAERRRAAS